MTLCNNISLLELIVNLDFLASSSKVSYWFNRCRIDLEIVGKVRVNGGGGTSPWLWWY
jgi:hypothetical protein